LRADAAPPAIAPGANSCESEPAPSLVARGHKGDGSNCQKRLAAMSDTQLTTIARLDERLKTLKERL